MTPSEVLIKNDSTVIWKGIPFRVMGFRENTQMVILEKYVDVPLSELELTEDIDSTFDSATVNTSDDFLYMKIHQAIRKRVQKMDSFTELDLEKMIEEALDEN